MICRDVQHGLGLGPELSASICQLGTERSFGSPLFSKVFTGPDLGECQCWTIEGRPWNVKSRKYL